MLLIIIIITILGGASQPVACSSHLMYAKVFEAHRSVQARIEPGGAIMLNDPKLDRLCRSCGHAFSQFLHEMAEHNSKIAACPRCGKPHHFKHSNSDKPVAAQRRARRMGTNT
jgi:hypothetical protein